MSGEGPVFPVAFDELAMAEDLARLGGCLKTYVPWPTGRFGAVMVAVSHPERAVGLRVIAFGARHQPRGSRALSVYQIAHRRIHG
jgi:hypothetical protein